MILHRLAVLLVALVPGVMAWWTGQRLLRHVDDPALPDLLLRRRARIRTVWAIAFVALIAFDSRQLAWAIPLMIGAAIAGGYPARRVLLGETWGVGAYLWHTLRRLVGGVAFWVLLGFTPTIVLQARDGRLAVALAVVLGVTLLLWERHYRSLWLWAHGATRLESRPALDARFAAVVAKSTAAPPLLYRFGAPGERVAAAYAFPNTPGTGAVIFSDELLELLAPDEVTAVFAHEVAHLEHYTPARLRRARLTTTLLIVALLALSLLARRWEPAAGSWLSVLGPLAVVAALLTRASRGKARETESDLRGAALCGDAEALVRALTKLHVALRLPRRWPADVERTASHPSLAHRIRALRAAAGPAASAAAEEGTALAAPVVLRSSRAGSWVVIEPARLHLLDGVPGDVAAPGEEGAVEVAALAARAAGSRSVAYERLSGLVIEEGGRDAPRLVVTERSGRRWSVPLAPAEARAARAALDVVDVRLGAPAADRGWKGAMPNVLAAALAAALLAAGQLGVLLVPAAIALFRPSAAALAGLGAAAVVRVGIALLGDGGASWDPRVAAVALAAAAVLGALALGLASRLAGAASAEMAADEDAEDASAARARLATLALGILALLYAAGAGWAASLSVPSAADPLLRTLAALLAGLAGAAAMRPELGRRRWLAVAGAAAAGLVALALALPPASEGEPAPAARPAAAQVTASATIPGAARELAVSPSGAYFVVRQWPVVPAAEDDVEDEALPDEAPSRAPRLALGALGSDAAPRDVRGLSATFLSDDELLVLAARSGDSLELRLEGVAGAAAAPAWSVALPGLLVPQLHASAAARSWVLTGRDPAAPRVTVVLEGRVGAPGFTTRRWPAAGDGTSEAGFSVLTPVRGGALAVRVRGDYRASFVLSLAGVSPWVSELWRLEGGGERRVAAIPGLLHCVAGAGEGAASDAGSAPDDAVVCAATDARGNAALLAIGADDRVERFAALPGPAVALAAGPGGRVAAGVPGRRELLLFDRARRTASRVALPADVVYPTEMRWVRRGLAVLARGASGTTRIVLLTPGS